MKDLKQSLVDILDEGLGLTNVNWSKLEELADAIVAHVEERLGLW